MGSRLAGDTVDEFTEHLEQCLRQALADTYEEAKRLSLGPYKSSDLTKIYGSPFAKYGPKPGALDYPLPHFVINYQTGDFYRGWEKPKIEMQGDNLIGDIVNRTKEADFLKAAGNENSKSVARPIEPYLQGYLEARLELYLIGSLSIRSIAS